MSSSSTPRRDSVPKSQPASRRMSLSSKLKTMFSTGHHPSTPPSETPSTLKIPQTSSPLQSSSGSSSDLLQTSSAAAAVDGDQLDSAQRNISNDSRSSESSISSTNSMKAPVPATQNAQPITFKPSFSPRFQPSSNTASPFTSPELTPQRHALAPIPNLSNTCSPTTSPLSPQGSETQIAMTKNLKKLQLHQDPYVCSQHTLDSALSKGRFILGGDDAAAHHYHQLKCARRQEKLGGMLRDILGSSRKVRDDAVSAMPDLGLTHGSKDPLSLMSGLVSQIRKGEADAGHVVKHSTAEASLSLIQKYGKCQEVIGKGAYGTVRVAHKYDRDTQCTILFAVKEFKKKPQESENNFNKRLTSEFCISSSLHDINIIHTLDLMKDARGEYCQVMEYCDGGDLYSLILSSDEGLEQDEADCFFKQLVSGVVYMHSIGVAHCDLKPENLLLTCNGVLKISDFGNAECFRMAWETEVHMSTGVCGSRPYIAPEQFRDKEFDPRSADVWAVGVIYMAMRTGSYLWQVAIPDEDMYYEKYLQGRKQKNGFEPIENLRRARCRNVIYSVLDPSPTRRINAKQILNSEWVKGIKLCEAGSRGY